MFWSAALELKSQQQRPARSLNSSYGSFSRSSSSGSFHIPQSIPEHQPVSQFTSPIPDQRRVEEYFERPDTAFARTRASLQLSEHTQSALKLLLQGERSKKGTRATVQPQYSQDIYSMSKISGYSAHQAPMKQLEHTPLLLQARSHGQEEANPQENGNEHNYWMQELERRRAGLRQSRRRTSSNSIEAVNNLLGIGGDRSVRARHDAAAEPRTGRMEKTFARPSEELEEESAVMTLDLDKHQTRLRGVQNDKTH
ncbi:hypothetical protein BBJ29_004230 [Phytophthora kernoviae]|uniref:Uncharacterized protein n=1 Tax=Phytophthora kernoviae TaxID=325452 RepID=A0A3F2RPY0_9STRA|nr:hypothetical protein BBP00_00005128 [Phytophthora kernoviae]RLN64314.1 hypothetical protein BBJ29_004230 [Phytophthora kernoviae]